VKKSSCCDTREAHLGQRINRPGSRHRHGKLCFEGRHIHRLSRKCGHKAIIHKPKNKPAHVDFVVNGKVECYQDSKLFIPDAKAKDATALWPSHYSCEELDCCDDGEHAVKCGTDDCVNECGEISKFGEPKILDDVDFNDGEWGDFLNIPEGKEDDVLMGLLGIGDS